MDLWDALGLKSPAMLACIGAGGKTSLILTLAKEAKQRKALCLVSTTTKMYFSEAAAWNPIITSNFTEGAARVAASLHEDGLAAWYSEKAGVKVNGLPVEWFDIVRQNLPDAFIILEADGARNKWLKAPTEYEPIIPLHTDITVGILNLKAIGQTFSSKSVHRLELVLHIVKKHEGECITWQDLAMLAMHQKGIFQYSKGQKILLLTGLEAGQYRYTKNIADFIKNTCHDIKKCMAVKGHGENLEPVEVYNIW